MRVVERKRVVNRGSGSVLGTYLGGFLFLCVLYSQSVYGVDKGFGHLNGTLVERSHPESNLR